MAFNGTAGSAAIANASTAIDLHGYFNDVLIWTDSGSADIGVCLANTTAVLDAANTVRIQAGKANGLKLEGGLLSGFTYIGASATGRINWVAYEC